AADDSAARGEVDSGRLAEPFWYPDSPLTTPDPRRPFTGRPPRGAVPPAGPGILVPDAPVTTPAGTRFRECARDGLLLLLTPGTTSATKETAEQVARTVAGPASVLELEAIDSTGALNKALRAGRREVWVIRPDAHVAAVLAEPGPTELARVVRQALGGQSEREGANNGVLPANR
ncbi:MAG TPA: pentachlorophenol monooxygenase, partial [Amycolatopsis sp.]|nr:pentachlorophenol monooxygenase [Amycolatopsis sp.]